MKKTKISITKTYTIDLLTGDNQTEKEIQQEAETYLDTYMRTGTDHYYQYGDTEYTLYDVTNTDDPFDPVNENIIECPVCDQPFINGTCEKCDKLVNEL